MSAGALTSMQNLTFGTRFGDRDIFCMHHVNKLPRSPAGTSIVMFCMSARRSRR